MIYENVYRNILDNLVVGVVSIASDGKIIYLNKIALSVLKIEKVPAGRDYRLIMSEYPELAETIGDALKSSHYRRSEIEILHADVPMKVLICQSPVLDDAGKNVGVSIIFKNITYMRI